MAEERVQRRLAAILAADVVGYSRMMGADEEGTLARLNALRRELLHPKVSEYGGRIVKTTGDGTLIEFPSAVDAVQHAVDVQEAMRRRAVDIAEDRRIELRMGINVGDVIVEGDDLYGDGVNVASRLEGLASPGEICVSGFVHAQVKHKLDLVFESMGEQSLKNIAEPVDVYRVVIRQAEDASLDTKPTDAMFRRPAVAVLPFENLSGDPEQDYFADGLTEDIITALSLWRSFPVIARNSTFAYKGKSPDIRKVGEELSARYVVEGSVRKAGNRVRITAQLINAETGHHVWADRFDRDLEDIFALQDEVTERIAAIIEPTIGRTEVQRISTKPTSDLDAWEYCLRGWEHIYEVTKEANEKARALFDDAIQLDPNFARAHAGRAFTFARDLRFFGAENGEEWRRVMMESARRAVALNGSDSEARTILALSYLVNREPEAAVSEARQAVELNPNYAFAHNVMGATLSFGIALYEEGIHCFEQALRLNPLDPQNYLFLAQLATANVCAGRYEMAIEHARESIRQHHDFIESRVALASALGYLDRSHEAHEAIKGFENVAADSVEQHVGYARELKERILGGLRKANLVE